MSFDAKLRLRFWEQQNHRCPLCEVPIISREVLDQEATNLDHILPRSFGGKGGENLQLTHLPCNSEKGNWLQGRDGRTLRQEVWRNQGHACPYCRVVLYPSMILDTERSLLVVKPPGREQDLRLIHPPCLPGDLADFVVLTGS